MKTAAISTECNWWSDHSSLIHLWWVGVIQGFTGKFGTYIRSSVRYRGEKFGRNARKVVDFGFWLPKFIPACMVIGWEYVTPRFREWRLTRPYPSLTRLKKVVSMSDLQVVLHYLDKIGIMNAGGKTLSDALVSHGLTKNLFTHSHSCGSMFTIKTARCLGDINGTFLVLLWQGVEPYPVDSWLVNMSPPRH